MAEGIPQALAALTARGYCLWDVIAESERAGSLDSDIKNARPADIRGLLRRHPSITKVSFASTHSPAFHRSILRVTILH